MTGIECIIHCYNPPWHSCMCLHRTQSYSGTKENKKVKLSLTNLRNTSEMSSSRSSKVIDLDVNQKRIYNFLLATNINFGRISYRLRDIDAFSSNIACFPHPAVVWCPHLRWPFSNFTMKFSIRKLESWGYQMVKKFVIFDIQTMWRSGLSVTLSGCQKLLSTEGWRVKLNSLVSVIYLWWVPSCRDSRWWLQESTRHSWCEPTSSHFWSTRHRHIVNELSPSQTAMGHILKTS